MPFGLLEGLTAAKAIGGGIQSFVGTINKRNTEKKRPDRTEAAFLQPFIEEAASQTTMEMPGADLARTGIAKTQANTLEGARQAGASGAALNSILGASENNANNAYLNLAENNAAFRASRLRDYLSSLRAMSDARTRDQQFGINENTRKINEANALIGSGLQNIYSGASEFGEYQSLQQ